MTALSASAAEVLDADSITVLREIFAEPSLPVGTTALIPGGETITVLREALDHLTTVRAAAIAVTSPIAGRNLLTALAGIDPDLAAVLDRHIALGPLLAGAPTSRARNALLGDIDRGDIAALVETVELDWGTDGIPTDTRPLGRLDGRLRVHHYPGLYATLVARSTGTAGDAGATGGDRLIVLPTHRDHITWERTDSPGGVEQWTVRLRGVIVHRDEVVDLGERSAAAPSDADCRP